MTLRDDGGVRQYFINRLAQFSNCHFVETTDGHPPIIRFGCELFSCNLYYLKIDGSAVASVDWRSGQATDMAGRDMNDWHVALWYHHPDGPRFPGCQDMRHEEIFIVGHWGPRIEIEKFGKSFVEFLREAGVGLKPTDDPNEFTMTGKSLALM